MLLRFTFTNMHGKFLQACFRIRQTFRFHSRAPCRTLISAPSIDRICTRLSTSLSPTNIAGRNNIVQGHLNTDLTPIGVNQATATRMHFRECKYWQAHCSDLARAYRTAEIIMLDHPEVTLSKTPLLRECGVGAQEGLPQGTSRYDSKVDHASHRSTL